jgi:hypothetical protein
LKSKQWSKLFVSNDKQERRLVPNVHLPNNE